MRTTTGAGQNPAYQPNRGLGTSTPNPLGKSGFTRANYSPPIGQPGWQARFGRKSFTTPPGNICALRGRLWNHIGDNPACTMPLTAQPRTKQRTSRQCSTPTASSRRTRTAASPTSHFHHHIWRAVPIPRYDAGNGQHRELASLCGVAEQAAAGVRDRLPSDTGQIKLCEAIRRELRACGISGLIDEQARAILPRHSTPAA